MNNELYDVEAPLLSLGDASEYITIKQTFNGLISFGAIGSGKSSSLKTLALKMLSQGYGGLVLTVKPDECATWITYAEEANRAHDVIIVSPHHRNYFNVMQYLSNDNSGLTYVDNIIYTLKKVVRAISESDTGLSNDPFWQSSTDRHVGCCVGLAYMAFGDKLTMAMLCELAQSAPRRVEEYPKAIVDDDEETTFMRAMNIAKEKMRKAAADWQAAQDNERLEQLSQVEFEELINEEIPGMRLYKMYKDYFFSGLFNISSKTRGIIELTFSNFIQELLTEPIYTLFNRYPANFTPEDCLDGKIIIIDLPTKIYEKAGHACQLLFKTIWMKSMEKRNIRENGRPVFLWVDECQTFVGEIEAEFQATARSSRIATVYLTQNLPNLYAAMGGERSVYKVKSFCGNMGTKLFFANTCPDTNDFAVKLIGEGLFENPSENFSYGGGASISVGKTWSYQPIVRPEDIVRLKMGGPPEFRTQAYIVMQGTRFANGYHFKKVSFNQLFTL